MIIIANFCAGCSVMTFGCVLERHAANFLMAAALFIAIPCCAVATWCADPFVKRLRGAAAAILAQDAGGTDIPIDASSATADQRVCFPCSRHRWNYSTRRPHMHAYTLAKRGQVRGGKGHIQEGITARSRCPCSTSCYHAWTPAVCSSMAQAPWQYGKQGSGFSRHCERFEKTQIGGSSLPESQCSHLCVYLHICKRWRDAC